MNAILLQGVVGSGCGMRIAWKGRSSFTMQTARNFWRSGRGIDDVCRFYLQSISE